VVKRLKPWDQYVTEADREPLEVPLPGGESITVRVPSGGQIRAINRAQQAGDNDAAVIGLFGEQQGERLIALAEDAPSGALLELVKDVLAGFGLVPEPEGGSPASSS
jgi:hypothetical protein